VISVLLPYRDAAPTLDGALASVLADLEAGDEVIAIDDRSNDDGPRIVAAHAARDRRVVALTSRGEGIVPALAAGLTASRGDLVARMDGDDVSLPGRFAASRALLDRDPEIAVVGTRVEAFVDVPGASVGDGTSRYVAWQNALVSRRDHEHAIFVEAPVCHPSVTMRRSALAAVGGYHDSPWAEDWDLWLRMHEAGLGIAKLPRLGLRWRRHAGALTVTDPRYGHARLREARARYLSRWLARRGRPFAIWGAGKTGRLLARALEAHGRRPTVFVDIDPTKKIARGAEVLLPEEGLVRVRRDDAVLVVAVGAPGARDVVRARLDRAGLGEGVDYVSAA
jgi:glycosyltransferase involved in cell wall biosynthesis